MTTVGQSLAETLSTEQDLADFDKDVKAQFLKNQLNSLQGQLLETLTRKCLVAFSADGTESQRNEQVSVMETQVKSLRNGISQVRSALESVAPASE